jgi:hypothetical protein
MTRGGVFAISRKLFDPRDPFFGGEPFSRREAWQWLIAEAAYKPRAVRVTVGRAASMVQLERGQLSHSRAFMQGIWGWSERTLRTFLDHLERDGRIERGEGQQKGLHQCVITICKYDEYQFLANEPVQQSDQQRSNKVEKIDQQSDQQSDRQSRGISDCDVDTIGDGAKSEANETTNKKVRQSQKKGPEQEEGLDNKRKNTRSRAGEPSGFENWYETYPKKKARKAAERAYAKVVASGEISEPELLNRTSAFAASWASQPRDRWQFIPYPASWLNAGSYADEPDGAQAPTSAAPADPRTFSIERWQRCLAHHDRTGEWVWGPRPGAPDCLVPPVLLQERSRSPPDPPAAEPPVFIQNHPPNFGAPS